MFSSGRPRLTVSSVVVGALLLAAPSGAATTSTSTPVRARSRVVTLTDHGQDPAVVVDRRGNTTAVWGTHWCRGPVYAARRPAGGSWQAPVRIGRGAEPQPAVDAAGNVTVIFATNPAGRTTGLAAVRRAVGGPWSQPVPLTHDRQAAHYNCNDDEGTYGAHRADLGVSPRGAVVVVWQWGSGDRNRPLRIQSAYRAVGGHWSSPARLTRPNWSENPAVAIDRSGDATAVWSPHGTGTVASRRILGRGWGHPVRLAAHASDPDVAVAPGGTATVIFARAGDSAVVAVRRPPHGPWDDSRRLSPKGVDVVESEVMVDPSSTVSVVWQRTSGRIDAVLRPAGASWQRPVQVAPADPRNSEPREDLNDAGDLAVVWRREARGIVGRLHDHRQGWSATVSVVRASGYLPSHDVAGDPDGQLVTVWQTDDARVKARVVAAQ